MNAATGAEQGATATRPGAATFRRAMKTARFLAETESDGRAYELMAADFISGNNTQEAYQ